MSRATFDFEIVNYIIYYRRGSEKTRSDTVVYKLLDYFRWVDFRMAQIACDFVHLIGEIRLLVWAGRPFSEKPILVLRCFSYFYQARNQSACGLFAAEK